MIRTKAEVENTTGITISCGRKTFLPFEVRVRTLDGTSLAEVFAQEGLKVTVQSVFCPYCGKEVSARSKKGLSAHIYQAHKDVKKDDKQAL